MCFRIHQRAIAPGQGLEPRSRRSERRILPIERTRIAVRRRTARGTRTLITAGLSRGPLPVGLERRGHHEDSNPVLLVTKEVFYLSNSGGERYGENHELKKEHAALPVELQAHAWTCWDSNPEPADYESK